MKMDASKQAHMNLLRSHAPPPTAHAPQCRTAAEKQQRPHAAQRHSTATQRNAKPPPSRALGGTGRGTGCSGPRGGPPGPRSRPRRRRTRWRSVTRALRGRGGAKGGLLFGDAPPPTLERGEVPSAPLPKELSRDGTGQPALCTVTPSETLSSDDRQCLSPTGEWSLDKSSAYIYVPVRGFVKFFVKFERSHLTG